MPVQPTHDTDVLVIGGGPAGSTAATLLARSGWRVCLLEKDRHPRFHIGESLLPMNLPILRRLGVLDQVAAIGVRKLAADFPVDGGAYHSFPFARALGARDDHAFQVRREQFDHLLLRNAAAAGVDVREVTEAVQVDVDGPLPRVTLQHAGQQSELRCRYVVDASGRDTLLGRQWQLKRPNPRHRSAAIYAHFRGVVRRPGDQAGNISIYRLPRGWVWMIPLPDEVMSVGVVCEPEYLKSRRGPLDQFLLDSVRQNSDARQRMTAATALGPAEATGNYSYACEQIAGRGWVLAGDAYAFIDPIFSSGVFLAMHGAELAADVVDGSLRQPAREAALQRAYARRLQRGIGVFSWFIERFMTPTMRQLFSTPRNRLRVEQAVIAMLAGDVFDNAAARWRLQLFRLIYAVTERVQRRQAAAEALPSTSAGTA